MILIKHIVYNYDEIQLGKFKVIQSNDLKKKEKRNAERNS